MQYIIALGNPGTHYQTTRHNLGWRVVDALIAVAGLEAPRTTARYHGSLTEGVWEGEMITVLYPTTFMNKSGEAAMALVPRDKRSQLIVVHDEVALPLGKLRISVGSSAGGHNGVQSLIDSLGTNEFIRIRLGVGAPPVGVPLDRFVLSAFLPEEEPVVKALVAEAVEVLKVVVVKGPEAAMQKWNGAVA